jgi:hypothetical protein
LKNKLVLFICVLPFLTFGQRNSECKVDKTFLNYLGKNELNSELNTYLTYRFLDFSNQDSVAFFKCKLNLQTNNLHSFYNNYSLNKSLFSSDTSAMLIASTKYLTAPNSVALSWFSQDSSMFIGANSVTTYNAFKLSKDPLNLSPEFLPSELRTHFDSYHKYYKRKPIIAAGLSMVVPGLGKLYNGRSRGFWPSFVTNVIYGLQTAENLKVLGVKHPYTIFTLGVFSVFYLSNIYGSFHDLKQVKIEKRKSFLHEVADYYHTPDLFK